MVMRSCIVPFRTIIRGFSNNSSHKDFMKNIMPFNEYKHSHVESFEKFKNSPTIQLLAKGNAKKIERAYEQFCRSQYAEYKQQQMGGNPSEML